MRRSQTTVLNTPFPRTLAEVADGVQNCTNCELYLKATHGVSGAGPATATLMLIGEQPGNEEDLQGLPFVGPAGRILDRAFAEAGIERDEVYVSNAVKHFYFEPRGKIRLHKKPRASHISACRPWLEAEIEIIRPKVIVPLGATAAQAVLGPGVRIQADRGKALTHSSGSAVVLTTHPSFVLRIQDRDVAKLEFENIVKDLKFAKKLAAKA